jgi:hypothetical protein
MPMSRKFHRRCAQSTVCFHGILVARNFQKIHRCHRSPTAAQTKAAATQSKLI